MAEQIHLNSYQRDAQLVRTRIIASAIVVIAAFIGLMVQAYNLQVLKYDYYSTRAENNRIHTRAIPPARGLIYDRNGVLLADNRVSFSLTFTRDRVPKGQDWRSVLDTLVEILALSPEDRELFERRTLQTRRSFEPALIMSELNEEQRALVAVNQHLLPGIEEDVQFVRHYPQDEHFTHTVGYVGRINIEELKKLDPSLYSGTNFIGKTGIERFYEEQLLGQVGIEEVETNARGRVLRVLSRTEPVAGKDIYLTLDSKLQAAAEEALAGRRGAIVAIQVNTGEILAMVSQPSFDPNQFVLGIGFKAYADLRDSIDAPLFNRFARGLYPPGSVIKPMGIVSGLESGKIDLNTKVFDPGYYQLKNSTHKYRNWNKYGDGWVDIKLSLARSNDTFFYSMAHEMGIEALHKYMSQFGFGQRVALDVYGESSGLMPSPEWKKRRFKQVWYPGETVILGIGQGYMQTTPIQMAQATVLIATSGKWIRPHLAKTIGGEPPVDPEPMPDIKVKNPMFWQVARDGMEEVLHGARGTARAIGNTAVYRMAGKSGTAQVKSIPQGERYNRDKLNERLRDHALFVAYAPAHKPEIAVAVMVENGEAGGRVAAPVAKAVLDAWLLDENGVLKEEYRDGTERGVKP